MTKIGIFSLPQRIKYSEKMWENAISRKDRNLSDSSRVCHVQFTDEELAGNYRNLTINGKLVLEPKVTWNLPHGSVPSLFPGLFQFAIYFCMPFVLHLFIFRLPGSHAEGGDR